MKKRGRPKQNGFKPVGMLERAALAVFGYDQARRVGTKHLVAIKEAVRFLQATHSRMPVSEPEVRRILADRRSNRRPDGLLVSRPDPANRKLRLHDGQLVKLLWTAAVGPRPHYPRTNAAKPLEQPKPKS
jgi:hypothetical protein